MREILLNFHKEYYSSNIMTMSILGRESLDELEQMVSMIMIFLIHLLVELQNL